MNLAYYNRFISCLTENKCARITKELGEHYVEKYDW
jgi:hypothetical protein